jgi:acyl carrier protein
MTHEEALEWIAEVFEEPAENITPETTRDDVKGWDSLGILNLMAALDEEFDIQLSEEELFETQTVEDILEIFRKHGHLE